MQMLIGGEWVDALAGGRLAATSPASGEVLGEVPDGDRADAQRAIAAARAAVPGWSRLTAFERAKHLHAIADRVEHDRAELARALTLDQGKPLHAESFDEVDELASMFRLAAEDGIRCEGIVANSSSPGKRVLLIRRPVGVVSCITPWNWPYTMPAEIVAPALAVGNTVVWTPAPSTAYCSVVLARTIHDSGLPPGVFNLVLGPGPVVGDELAANPGTQAVAFIGSTATGRRVAERAAGKRLLLEMGGNGPLVVLDDANVEAAVDAAIAGAFLCAGQSCTAAERILVHESVYDAFAEALVEATRAQVRLGDPLDPATTMGPLNNEPVAAKMDAHVADAVGRGARAIVGGARADGFPTRLYWPATILLDTPPDSIAATDETFGPIAPLVRIRSLDDAIAQAVASPYGLTAAIFTADLEAGLRFADEVPAGSVNINETTNYWESHLPFGGRAGTASGVGRVGGRYALDSFSELQTVTISPRGQA